MSVVRIVLFAGRDYPFLADLVDSGEAVVVDEPAHIVETIKQHPIAFVIFDIAHRHFSESLVNRIYRKVPEAEFWLLSNRPDHYLPEYLVDAVIPPEIRPEDFKTKINTCSRIRGKLAEYGMVGKSANLKQVAQIIEQIAPTDVSTLIIGPSGTGKELIAHALHSESRRRGKPFVAFNCGALTETLLESELFGYEKGAFTGAAGRREGIFKRADGGTVFLDEIADTSPALQVKLLRVLEEGTFYRVGGGELVRTDIRVVAATNRELLDSIAEGKFREDLYFRLGAMRINLARLSERPSDIIPLVHHFFLKETGTVRGISRGAMEKLILYGWPGNVRQLRNFVSRMTVLPQTGEISESMVIQFIEEQGYVERHLPVATGKLPQEAEFQLIYQALLSLGQEVRMLRELMVKNLPSVDAPFVTGEPEPEPGAATATVEEMEETLIRRTLDNVGGNRREAARRLGIGERTLYRKLKKYGDT